MIKVWSYIFPHKGNSFELAVFQNIDGYIFKIFLDNNVVNEFTATITEEFKHNWELYQTSSAFEELANLAKEWVRQNDQNERFTSSK